MSDEKPVEEMSADELRVAIAEAKGWTDIRTKRITRGGLVGFVPAVGEARDVPNWPAGDGAARQLRQEILDAGMYVDSFANKGQEILRCGKNGTPSRHNTEAVEMSGDDYNLLMSRIWLDSHRRGWLTPVDAPGAGRE